MVLLHVGEIFGFFKFVEGFYDVGEDLYLFLFGEFGVEVKCLEGLFQEGKHH